MSSSPPWSWMERVSQPSSMPSASMRTRRRASSSRAAGRAGEEAQLVDEAADLVALDDVGDVAGDDELALLEDDGLIAEVVELAEDVRGDEDGDAALAGAGEDVAQVAAAARVEAVGGLVEDEQARAVEQAAGDEQALAHALGQGAGGGVALVDEVEGGEHLVDGGRELGLGELEALAEEAQVLGRRHVLVERVTVAEEADLTAQGGLVGARPHAVELDAALAGGEHGGEHAQGGRLAGAVGADEADDRAAGDREGEAADGPALAVVGLAEVLELDAHAGAANVPRAAEIPPGRS
jgi:hypothetical protein